MVCVCVPDTWRGSIYDDQASIYLKLDRLHYDSTALLPQEPGAQQGPSGGVEAHESSHRSLRKVCFFDARMRASL